VVSAALAGFLFIVYGGVFAAVGALVPTGAVNPAAVVDRTTLAGHVIVWLWFLVWSVLLAVATIALRHLSLVD
jgi:hypothetical protein